MCLTTAMMAKFDEKSVLTQEDVEKAIKGLDGVEDAWVSEESSMLPAVDVDVDVRVYFVGKVPCYLLHARLSMRENALGAEHDGIVAAMEATEWSQHLQSLQGHGRVTIAGKGMVSVILASPILYHEPRLYPDLGDRSRIGEMMLALRNTCKLIGKMQDNRVLVQGDRECDWIAKSPCLRLAPACGSYVCWDPASKDAQLMKAFNAALERMVIMALATAWIVCGDGGHKDGLKFIKDLFASVNKKPEGKAICKAIKMVFTAKNLKSVAYFIDDEGLTDVHVRLNKRTEAYWFPDPSVKTE